MLVDSYIDLFENANKRHALLEKLEKEVKQQLRQVETERVKLRQVLLEIRRTKDANKIEERQLVAINDLLKDFERTAHQLVAEDEERLVSQRVGVEPVDLPQRLFELIDRMVPAKPTLPQVTTTIPATLDELTTFIMDDEPEAKSADTRLEVERYCPWLYTLKPPQLVENLEFTLPPPATVVISSTIDPSLALKLAQIQVSYIANHVPWNQWGVLLVNYLQDEALDAYLDYYHTRSDSMLWSDVLFLFFADKDLYKADADAINRWCKMAPEPQELSLSFVTRFKHAVNQLAPFPGRLDVEKALLVLQLDLPYEVTHQLQTITDRHQFYSVVMKRLR